MVFPTRMCQRITWGTMAVQVLAQWGRVGPILTSSQVVQLLLAHRTEKQRPTVPV